ncbi:MAG: hypothetical protein ABR956_13395 [Terracidiphilus sp.]
MTVAGKSYMLWFAIPQGYPSASVHVEAKTGKAIPAEWHRDGQFASLQFTGTGEPAEWRVQF